MAAKELLRASLTLAPIVMMLFVGGVLAVRSGDVRLADGHRFRQVLGNLSHMMLGLAGWVLVLLLLHVGLGLHMFRFW